MRRGRIFIYLALVLIIGLAAVLLLPRLLGGGPSAPAAELTSSPTPVPVQIEVVAVVQPLKRGDPLTMDVLQMIPISEDTFAEGMFTAREILIGRLVKFDLEPGVLLTSDMLFTQEQLSTTGSDWALLIPRGMVAVSIPINRLSSISFAPRRGDHVMVIATMLFVDLDAYYQSLLPNQTALIIAPGPLGEPGKSPVSLTGSYGAAPGGSSPLGRVEIEPQFGEEGSPFYVIPSEPQRPRLVSQTLIQNVMVLQIGDFPLESEEKAKLAASKVVTPTAEVGTPATGEVPQATPTPIPLPPTPDLITLVVSPQDAVTLNYLIYSGAQLNLALRSMDDDSPAQTEAVTLQFLLDQYGIPVPVKLPFGMEPAVSKLSPPVLKNDNPTPTPQP